MNKTKRSIIALTSFTLAGILSVTQVFACHGIVTSHADCDGWDLNISASPLNTASWNATPSQSGDWSSSNNVDWSVDFSWSDNSTTDYESGSLSKPDNCDEPEPTPTPTEEPTPTPTPTEEPTPTPTPTDEPEPTPTPEDKDCVDESPTAIPNLSVYRNSPTTAYLTWNSVGPVDHYMVRYGSVAGEYEFGSTDIGNTIAYEVKDLNPDKNYHFQIAAANGCASSGWSNDTGSGQVLGAMTHETVDAGLGSSLGLLALLATGGSALFALLYRVSKRFYLFDR